MKGKSLFLIILVIIAAAALFLVFKKGTFGSRPFKVGDYIQKINSPDSEIWKITKIDPDLVTTQGTGALYAICVRAGSEWPVGATSMWGIAETQAKYVRVNFTE
jgi:hypothetical protein